MSSYGYAFDGIAKELHQFSGNCKNDALTDDGTLQLAGF